MRKRDVIIVGAGVGGSTCAHFLAKAGIDVLLLEKDQFPRDKPCGDGQVQSIHPLFKEMGIHDEIEKHAYKCYGTMISDTSENKCVFNYKDGEFAYCTPRYIFDDIVNKSAVNQGIDYLENFEVTDIIMDRGWAKGIQGIYQGKTVEIESKIIVIANGSHSMVARKLGYFQEDPDYLFYGLRGYFENVRGLSDVIEFHYPSEFFLPAGYIWLFPMSATKANVGVFITESCLKKSNMTMEELLYWWRDNSKIGQERLGEATLLGKLKGWRLPTWGMTKEIHGNGVLAVGDAANMIEPLFGGGIPHAMISGKVSAAVIAMALKHNNYSKEFFDKYREEIDKVLGPGYKALTLFRNAIFSNTEDLSNLVRYTNTKLANTKCSGGEAFVSFMKDEKGFTQQLGSVYGK